MTFLLSRQSFGRKLVGISLPLMLIGLFVLHTRDAAEKITGTKQFSLFTGWQLANNALYMYGHIRVDSTKLPSEKSKELDRLSQNFFSHTPTDFDDYLSEYGANYFIREPQAPLKQYFSRHYRVTGDMDEVVNWGKASVTFGEYGEWLIKNYPSSYIKHFMLMNVKNYFLPPLEKLEEYNLGQDEVWSAAEDWFDYKTPNVTSVSKTIQGNILFLFPYLFFFVNVLFGGSLAWLIFKRKTISFTREFSATILISFSFLVANFCFCVFATIIVMRYQFFPMIVTITFPLIFIEVLEKKLSVSKGANIQEKDNSITVGLAKS